MEPAPGGLLHQGPRVVGGGAYRAIGAHEGIQSDAKPGSRAKSTRYEQSPIPGRPHAWLASERRTTPGVATPAPLSVTGETLCDLGEDGNRIREGVQHRNREKACGMKEVV